MYIVIISTIYILIGVFRVWLHFREPIHNQPNYVRRRDLPIIQCFLWPLFILSDITWYWRKWKRTQIPNKIFTAQADKKNENIRKLAAQIAERHNKYGVTLTDPRTGEDLLAGMTDEQREKYRQFKIKTSRIMDKQIHLEMKDIFPLIYKARQAEDPLSVLLAFDLLHLKPGFTLKAFPYECCEGSIGNVWAMPETYDDKKSELIDLFSLPRPFPIENSCLDGLTMGGENILIRPAEGLENIMDAIEGDESLRSYFYASLFAREIAEFGASMHGVVWSCHIILGSDPWDFSKLFGWDMGSCEIFEMSEFEQFKQQGDNWIWLKTKPMDFRPFVALEKDIVTVRFYTYTGFVNQTIYCYTDTYKLKNYVFNSNVEPIADSGIGYII